MGGMDFNVIYNNIYTAIQRACPSSSPSSSCPDPAFSSFKVQTHKAAGEKPIETDAVLHIVGGKWHGSTAIYYLMVGAIAGAIERGTYTEKNCETFQTEKNVNRSSTYCNTMDSAKVELPGDKGYYLEVRMETVAGMGEFDCSAISSTVESYLDSLKPEVEQELKMTELYVEAKCLYG
ncbi:hypothetical protein IAQ61_003440 [Plenodomus lingam]|nr:hypothetical protein IAQ61_003440 [Plenodomus lingam]